MYSYLFLVLSVVLSGNEYLIDRIAARIENEVIMLSDISKKVEILTGNKVEYNENDPKISKLYTNVLNELIEDKIIQIELKKMGQDVTESEIRTTIEDIRKQRGVSEDEFLKLLLKEGLSYEQYKDEIKRQIRKSKFIALKVRQRVKITDEDARFYYNKEFAKNNMSFDVSIIYIKDNPPQSNIRLEDLKKGLLEKVDFAELAKKYSDDPTASSGGHLGSFSKGKMREDFENAISNLKEGEISEILKFPEGYYVFKVNKILGGEIKDFDEVKEDIKRFLFEKEIQKQYSYIIDSLKKKYTLHINLK